MRTIIKKNCWKILELFYKNKNKPLHLREIARSIELSEGPLTRHLNMLLKNNILISSSEANLKKFRIKKSMIPEIFSFFDMQRFKEIPFIRKNAMNFFLDNLKEKPVFIIIFGSTAKGTFKKDSDIDLITVFNRKTDTKKARKYAEAQTGIKINEFQMTYNCFLDEIKLKKDHVIQAGLETGFPVFNALYFHKAIKNG